MASSSRHPVKSTQAGLTRAFAPGQPRRRPVGRTPALSKPIRILHVHGHMARGGAEMRTVEVFRHLDRRRYQFHFCAASGLAGTLDEEIRALGGEVHLLRRSRIGFPRRFQELLRERQIDVVHSHLHHDSGYFLGLAAECGTPMRVAHFRSSHFKQVPGLRGMVLRKLINAWDGRYAAQAVMRSWIDRHATNILGVSRWALSSAWGPQWRSDPRCQVVYDGLEPSSLAGPRQREGVRREFGLPNDGPLYIHVGRMAEPKNHLRLVEIFSAVLRRQPAARLLLIVRTVIGRVEKTIERRVRRRIAELGIADRVTFGGERTDVPRLIKAADLLIFPSLWEGLGNVVLEACGTGTPALCSDLPCIREIAGLLPGVRCLSLDEPNAKWARLAHEMASSPPSERTRQAALECFTNSVFNLKVCTKALCRIWESSRMEPKPGVAAHG